MFDESGTTLLNGVRLKFEKGFGFNQSPNIKNTAYCIDDNRIIYLLASQIVIYEYAGAVTQRVIDTFDYDEEEEPCSISKTSCLKTIFLMPSTV